MAQSSPLSYQIAMPEYPDVSYQRWRNIYGGPSATRLGSAFYAWSQGSPNYETWRTNHLDVYNAAWSKYNAWASSPAGHRAQNEAAGYNVNYSDTPTSQGSPLSYQDVNPQSGASEMAQGLSGLMSLFTGIQGLQATAANIAGKKLENTLLGEKIKSQEIQNKWLDRTLGFKSFGLGYQADYRRLQNEAEIYSRFAGTNLGKSDYLMDSFGPGLSLMYDLNRTQKGFMYNRQNADLAFLRAGAALRGQQKDMLFWDTKTKKFYNDAMQQVQKDLLEGQLKYLNGQINWQPTEQKLREKSIYWGIGINAFNSVMGAVKTITGIVNPLSGAAPTMFSPGWGNFPNQSHSYQGGWDVLNGELYSPYYYGVR